MTRFTLLAFGLMDMVFGANQSIVLLDDSHTTLDPAIVEKYVDAAHATISGPTDAGALIQAAQSLKPFQSDHPTPRVSDPTFFCVIHVVLWNDQGDAQPQPDGTAKAAQTVKAQNWYLYNGGKNWTLDDFNTNKRIFGAKSLSFLYVYLRIVPGTPFSARYEVTVTSKEPANVLHLLQAAAVFGPAVQQGAREEVKDYVGLANFKIAYVPSDISITPYLVQSNDRTTLGDSVKFDDEGYYYWDVSMAVPLRKMGQTQISTVNNTITVNTPDKRNVFAVLDLYPFKKDVKSASFDWRPYAVTGIAVGSQPLHKILVGIGWGPKFAQFYAGALFVKQPSLTNLAPGAAATPAQQAADTHTGFKPQFAFGINLPVREVFQAAGSAAKGATGSRSDTQKQ